MNQELYIFKLAPNWKLINQLSLIDRFGGSWATIEKREGQTLKQLKVIATVRSIGASTRIEGSQMTDAEVETLINNLSIAKLEERDQQEVAGYFEVLDLISASYRDIDITESSIKSLHNLLMKYSEKDDWHKGDYKQVSNEVEATNPDGTKHIIFKTTDPGLKTAEAMSKLFAWYKDDKEAHPLVRAATFVYEFLSIHPFQDGNGRLSRLLATLLLLREGYSWIEFVSFEHEIENRKGEYYKVLMGCQRQRPGEDIQDWLLFFLDCLANIQAQLIQKLEVKNTAISLSPREKKIYQFIENHPGSKSGQIADKLNIPLPTIKKILSDMVHAKLIQKHGNTAGTNYTIEAIAVVKKDLLFTFSTYNRKKEFLIKGSGSFVEIKKIILTPNFDWVKPDDWLQQIMKESLYLNITVITRKEETISKSYAISQFNNPYLFKPVFTLATPINIPDHILDEKNGPNDYPIKVTLELVSIGDIISFDVMVIYDEA